MAENVEYMIADELARVTRFLASCEYEVTHVANQLHIHQMHIYDKIKYRMMPFPELIVKYDLETVVIYRVNPELFNIHAEIIGRNTLITLLSPYGATTYGGKLGITRLLNIPALIVATRNRYVDVANEKDKWIIDAFMEYLKKARFPIEDYVIVRKVHVEDGKIRLDRYDFEEEFYKRTEDVRTRKYNIRFNVIALYPEYGKEKIGVNMWITDVYPTITSPIVEDGKYVVSKYVVDRFGELVSMGVEQIIRYAEFFSQQK